MDIVFDPTSAAFKTTNFPALRRLIGSSAVTNMGLGYVNGSVKEAFFRFKAVQYTSGNLTVKLDWYTSATSGNVTWGGNISFVTPGVDNVDMETGLTLTTEETATTSHPGGSARRPLSTTLTIANVSGLAADDLVFLRIARKGATDTLAAEVILTSITVSYT